MVKKRGVKKRVARKSVVKNSRAKRKNYSDEKIKPTRGRISLVVKNLILFAVLTLVSWILNTISNDPIYQKFFYLMFMILLFVSIAFLISFLVLLFLKALKRK